MTGSNANTPRTLPLETWMWRRRWYARLAWLSILAACLAWGMRITAHPQHWDIADRVTVELLSVNEDLTLNVADVRDPSRTTVIHLIGVTSDDTWRPVACAWIKQTCAARLLLTFDESSRRDPAGRLIAYAYLPDGRMLNETLIAQGLVRADRQASYALRDWFAKVESTARHAKKGIWNDPIQ